MNKAVAGELLDNFVSQLRQRSYLQLSEHIGDPQCQQISGHDDNAYQIEFEAFWDDPRRAGHNLRVVASVDDGTFFGALRPITRSFIMAPDGSFVGEESKGC
jgi:hypothetical protein